MKGLAKKAVRYAEDHDFSFERQNSKGLLYYRNPSGVEVCIPPGIADNAFRNICLQIDRACGIGPDLSQKRRPDQIRLRDERRRELERLRELAREHKAQLLAGRGAGMPLSEIYAKEREIEAYERRIREIERLMQPGAK